MKVGKADILVEWLERRRALLDQEAAMGEEVRRARAVRVGERIERLRAMADGFSLKRAANGPLVN